MSVIVPVQVNPAWTARTRASVARCEPDRPVHVEPPVVHARSSRPLGTPTASTPVSPRAISVRGEIRRGPHAGLILAGTLRFVAGRGGAGPTAELIDPDGVRIVVSRVKITGRALTLTLTLPDRGPIHACGVFEHDPARGAGLLAGVLTGPEPDDAGDWRGVFASGESPDGQSTARDAGWNS